MTEIWLTEPYYKEFHQRKGVYFDDDEAIKLYELTQQLQENWPRCIDPTVPPEVGAKSKLQYLKCDFPSGTVFRICFGVHTVDAVVRIVALSCRTKQELAKGNKNANQEWYRHMGTVGRARWADYQRGFIAAWKIY